MKTMLEMQKEYDASDFVMALIFGIPREEYLEISKQSIDELEDVHKERLKFLNENPGMITSFYNSQKEWLDKWQDKDLLSLVQDDLPNMSKVLGVGINVLLDFFNNGNTIGDKYLFDKIVDYLMISTNVLNRKLQEVPEVKEKPSVETSDNEVDSLLKQIEWYEDIIGCFVRLSKMAYKDDER